MATKIYVYIKLKTNKKAVEIYSVEGVRLQ